MATGRACLQKQERVCGYVRWDTQALHAAKSMLLVPLCFLSLFTDWPWESKCSKMAEQAQCFRKIQNCHFLVTDKTFSLCSLLPFSWNWTHNKGFFPLMRRYPGYTEICPTLQITKLKTRFPTQPDKISDGQRACAGKCIYLKQILPAASGKTTAYE